MNAHFGTFIAIGDSISAGGGQGPFYNDLLDQNDDATYPGWKGHDLATRFPGIMYVKAAQGGAVTGSYGDLNTLGAPLLTDQVNGLAHSYPGDVLVTMTIGGNDLNDHAGDAVTGLDAPDRTKFTANLKAALDALTAPGRLGSGKLVILEANIYDPSDGQGNFSSNASCPPFNVGSMLDQQTFGAWNQIVADAITAHGGADTLIDLHALFAGHGFNSQDNWYFSDCIHPNTKGHKELRRLVWRLLTGEDISQ
jgi:lysophospholipase L1-like esterase